MRIIQHSKRITKTHHALSFHWADDPGAGFSFDCDKDGNLLDTSRWCAAAEGNYAACLRGERDGKRIIADGIKSWQHSYRLPAVGRCCCGNEVDLDGFTNTCECGRDYNMSGQLLAPRSQWGEETGETAADILIGGYADEY